MSNPVISVRGLGKRYRLGETFRGAAGYETLRDKIMEVLKAPLRKKERHDQRNGSSNSKYFWALKDISFDVEEGEILGIIGANGAGKTTLLKILTQITDPTEGEIRMRGRVASLLEVGTGFHPELTGKENVYMNGAILGMTRQEIKKKFDEIVSFAEVEKFIDTPVKRYSVGMRVRLAFSVAAHLEPEIMLIDEVLAVGDISFQKKCLGKMDNITKQGRTVLFVSHNMASIQSLCTRGLLLEAGKIKSIGKTEKVINDYINSSEEVRSVNLAERMDRKGNGAIRITKLELWDEKNEPIYVARTGQQLQIALGYKCNREIVNNVRISIALTTKLGQYLFVCNNEITESIFPYLKGEGFLVCSIPKLPLLPGFYSITIYCTANGVVADHVQEASEIPVEVGDFFGTGRLPPETRGHVCVPHSWRAVDFSGKVASSI